jgi:rubrerythrin
METHGMDVLSDSKHEILGNRTGIMTNPELSIEMIEGAKQTVPSSQGDATEMAAVKANYIEEAVPIGSSPVMVEVSEDGESVGQFDGLAVLLDKLGERLAFERQGTRLYEAFLQKCESLTLEDASGPSVEELRQICEEELEHFHLLQNAITRLGGDATVQTPSADVAGVLSHGVMQVVSDPRTTIPQTLQAMLTAELVDNDGWQMLQELAAELGQDDLEEQCGKAYEEEQEHLEKVRDWLTSMTMDEASGSTEALDVSEIDASEEEASEEEEDTQPKRSAKASTRSGKSKSSSSSKSKSKKKKKDS